MVPALADAERLTDPALHLAAGVVEVMVGVGVTVATTATRGEVQRKVEIPST